MTFTSLGISKTFVKELQNQGYESPYPIQEKAIPSILEKKDVLGVAKTGSGKTVAYVLPILQLLKNQPELKNRHIPVLVLVPTRELAIQVEEVFKTFGLGLDYPSKSKAVYGGVSINPQMKTMNNVSVLVATPGRLLELIRSKALHLSSVSTLVLDEADKMLNLGFKAEVDEILALLPKKRQNILFSATLNPEIERINELLLKNPTVVNIVPEVETVELINQVGYFIDEEKKGPLLRFLLKDKEMQQVLIFTSSVFKADQLTVKLRKNGFNARAIHSKKSQGARQEALSTFKAGKLNVLVTTDLLARGIDIEFLPFVINYELPRSPKDFIHRIGRTGRAENPGEAITFVTEEDKHHFRVIQKKMKHWVTMIDGDKLV